MLKNGTKSKKIKHKIVKSVVNGRNLEILHITPISGFQIQHKKVVIYPGKVFIDIYSQTPFVTHGKLKKEKKRKENQ